MGNKGFIIHKNNKKYSILYKKTQKRKNQEEVLKKKESDKNYVFLD